MENSNQNQIEFERALGRVEGKVDGIKDMLENLCEQIKDQRNRLTTVEITTATMKGKVMIIGAFAGAVLAAVVEFFRSKFFK